MKHLRFYFFSIPSSSSSFKSLKSHTTVTAQRLSSFCITLLFWVCSHRTRQSIRLQLCSHLVFDWLTECNWEWKEMHGQPSSVFLLRVARTCLSSVQSICVFIWVSVCPGEEKVKAEVTQASKSTKKRSPGAIEQLYYYTLTLGDLTFGHFCHRSRFLVFASLLLHARRVNDAFKSNKMFTQVWNPGRLGQCTRSGLWLSSASPQGTPKA